MGSLQPLSWAQSLSHPAGGFRSFGEVKTRHSKIQNRPDRSLTPSCAAIGRSSGLSRNIPESYAPIFRKGADGKVSAEGWASGFVTGVLLKRDAWEPLTEAKEESVLLGPIFAQLDDKSGTLASNFEPSQLGAARELAADFIAQAVVDIERFWHARRGMVVPHQTIGRNAPCPCGSGRKYKRCCGTA